MVSLLGRPTNNDLRGRTRSFPRRRLALLSLLAPPAVLVAVAIVGPLLVPYSPIDVVARPDQPPSTEHWFGTDVYGLDVFSRVIAATRNDLTVGLVAALLATVLGIAVGLSPERTNRDADPWAGWHAE